MQKAIADMVFEEFLLKSRFKTFAKIDQKALQLGEKYGGRKRHLCNESVN